MIGQDVRVHPSAFVDEGAVVGDRVQIWHFSHVLPGARIGDDCKIGQNVVVAGTAVLGRGCKIQNNVSLYDGVVLEDFVFCGPSCVFTNVTTPRAEVNRREEYAPTLVRRGVSIGANATIVCGSEIGAYAFIAAGAVVTRSVPELALMAGVPARRVGWVSHAGEVLGPDRVCPRTGDVYEQVADERLVRIKNLSGIGPDEKENVE